ncbi:hypothetical protein F5B20DRAFT_591206 [Whalleya microplaca]|nr:hypothetical protein F5B20DRAFT_591206 [Whalleya microplaca]
MAESGHHQRRGPGSVNHDIRRHPSYKRTRDDDESAVDNSRRVRSRHGDERRSRRRGSDDDDGSQSPRHGRRHHDARREYRRRDAQSIEEQDEGGRSRDSRHARTRRPVDATTSVSRSHTRSHSVDSTNNRSNHHHHRQHHHRRHRHSKPPAADTNELPSGARALSRSADYDAFRPLLARYLEVQKQRDIRALDEREVRGRWRSFVRKWNEGALAAGWYDPETFVEARAAGIGDRDGEVSDSAYRSREAETEEVARRNGTIAKEELEGRNTDDTQDDTEDDNEEDEDAYGPTLPADPQNPSSRAARHGPGIPNLQDLALRQEAASEERQSSITSLRQARRADRAEQKARLEDLAPRADAGTHERRLEKRRELNDKLHRFRERSPGGAEVDDAELLGGGEGGGGDSVAEFKRLREATERRKSEREVRREEERRARAAEREERAREFRVREEGTMEVLRRIAKERFG